MIVCLCDGKENRYECELIVLAHEWRPQKTGNHLSQFNGTNTEIDVIYYISLFASLSLSLCYSISQIDWLKTIVATDDTHL